MTNNSVRPSIKTPLVFERRSPPVWEWRHFFRNGFFLQLPENLREVLHHRIDPRVYWRTRAMEKVSQRAIPTRGARSDYARLGKARKNRGNETASGNVSIANARGRFKSTGATGVECSLVKSRLRSSPLHNHIPMAPTSPSTELDKV